MEVDPASPANSHSLAVQLYLARQFDQAIEQCRKTLEMDPNFAVAYSVVGQAYAAKEMYRQALPEFEKYSALSHGSAMSVALLGYTHARLGERDQALRLLDRLQAASKQSYTPAFSFALIFTGLGEKDQAFLWLEKTYEERFTRLAYLKQEALWDSLHADPRFGSLVHRIGFAP